jgi:hypothetical protein
MDLIKAFLQQATAQVSRSTILRPMAWMMPLCIAATLGAVYVSAPSWLIAMFAAFCGLTMLLYVAAYVYCLLTDRDALRSESYVIHKMAMQRGYVGDSDVGMFAPPGSAEIKLIGGIARDVSEGDK